MRHTTKAGITLVITAALVALGAPLSSVAHTPHAALNCEVAHVNLTAYDRAATAEVTLDGETIQSGTFGGRYVETVKLSGNTEHTLTVVVKSFDRLDEHGVSPYDFTYTETTSGCYTPPALIPTRGMVSFGDTTCIDGVLVGREATIADARGIRYEYTYNGGPATDLATGAYYANAIPLGDYVITAIITEPDVYVYDGVSSWSHTYVEGPTDCEPEVVVPPKPEDLVEPFATSSLDCEGGFVAEDRGIIVTGSEYDAELNEWVRTAPVTIHDEGYPKTSEPSEEQCPPVVVPPTEPPVVTPPVTPPTEVVLASAGPPSTAQLVPWALLAVLAGAAVALLVHTVRNRTN
jgi:hypothetical protein